MSTKLKIHGRLVAPGGSGARGRGPLSPEEEFREFEDLVRVTKDHTYLLTDRARAATEEVHEEELKPGEAVQVTLESGHRIWLPAEDLPKLLDANRAGEWEVDATSRLRQAPGQRGFVSLVIKGLRVLGFDLEVHAADHLADWVKTKIEAPARGETGLYRCEFQAGLADPLQARERVQRLRTDPDQAILILLHGTGSSTVGSFKDLWNSIHYDPWDRLVRGQYHQQVYALEHLSLSESPAQNACALLDALPVGQTLHLVSHSRGGLVGELLCRGAMADGGDAITQTEIDGLVAAYGAKTHASTEETGLIRRQFQDLRRKLMEKRPRVERFVRVACPAMGTGLADERLDVFFNLLLWGLEQAAKAVPGEILSDLAAATRTVLLRTIKKRFDATELPGLEAMVPTSPFQRFLNSGRRVDADLTVVQGDADVSLNPLQFVATALLNTYYREANDWVVETNSMLGGQRRVAAPMVWLDKGGHVSHFNYFSNDDSFATVLLALQGRLDEGGFREVRQWAGTLSTRPPRRDRGAAQRQPVAMLLPGLPGSHLKVDNDRIWLDALDLLFGGLKKLRLDGNAGSVRPDGLLGLPYADFAAYLGARGQQVIPWDYDWRLDLETTSRALAKDLEKLLGVDEVAKQPISLVCHSMGGLVALYTILENPLLWERICAHPESRMILAGSPLKGTYSALQLLTGRHRLARLAALLDMGESHGDLVATFRTFPGLVQALPRGTTRGYFDPETWQRLRDRDQDPFPWEPPSAEILDTAHRVASVLDNTPRHTDRIHYVAGHAAETPSAERFPRGRLEFGTDPRGDGLALWEPSIPSWATAWYMEDVAHGDLLDTPKYFHALLQLMQQGDSQRLRRQPPAVGVRGKETGETRSIYSSEPVWLYPSETDVVAAALAADPHRRPAAEEQSSALCSVSIRHGDLRAVHGPVMVGHYQGDTINGSEKMLDAKLQGLLVKRHARGVYPGSLRSVEVFTYAGSASRDSAVVVGLGPMGQLTAPQLQTTLQQALEYFALHRHEQRRFAGLAPADLTLTSLLIGSGSGALAVEQALRAQLDGLRRANAQLRKLELPGYRQVEIVERYEDTALIAAAGLERLGEDFTATLRLNPIVDEGPGGLRAHYRFQYDPWWRIIRIAEMDHALYFTAVGDRAATPTSIKASDKELVNKLLHRATATTYTPPALGKALYELLIPREFKESISDQNGILLLVDEHTACYPWEMLQDRFDDDHRPLATQMPLIRQFVLESNPSFYPWTDQRNALIIADPKDTGLPPLPGALKEGERVAQHCRETGFTPTCLFGKSGMENVVDLFTRDYRILHLAGHGYLVPTQPAPDGSSLQVAVMALGDGITLTPQTIESMRQVPELVFINCCLVGKVHAEQEQYARDRHMVAAGLATAFLRMGARAVIAADWQVDDEAALRFAGTFYEQMLRHRETFGNAVHRARVETYEAFATSNNTWGAYQCYGDPAYRILAHKDEGTRLVHRNFHSPGEFAAWIDDLAQQKSEAGNSDPRGEQLDYQIRSATEAEQGWLKRDPVVQEAMGNTLGILGRFREALDYYHLAMGHERGAMTLKGLEQAYNLFIRWLEALDADIDPGELTTIEEQLEPTIDHLECLSKIGPTVERLNLLASAYKHQAMLLQRRQRSKAKLKEALYAARDAYEQASRLHREKTRGMDTYSLLNSISLSIVLKRRGYRKDLPDEQQLLAALDRIDAEVAPGGADFWAVTDAVNRRLLRLLVTNDLDRERTDELAAAYRAEFRDANPKDIDSVVKQIRFLRELLQGPAQAFLRTLLDALQA